MTTLDDLRIGLESDYLEPITERTAQAPLTSAIDATTQTILINATVLSPDEEAVIGPGAVLELDYELVFVLSYDMSVTPRKITASRGHKGGGIATNHVVDTMVRIPTRWPRQRQAAALSEALDQLWPPVYLVEEQRATVDTLGYLPLPLDTREILGIRYEVGDEWIPAETELLATHPLDDSFAAVQVAPTLVPGALAVIRYGRAAKRPATTSETLDPWDERWSRVVLLDAAAALLSGVDIDAVTQEYLTQQLRLDRFPVRSGSSIVQSLVAVRTYLVSRLKERQTASTPRGIEMRPVIYSG
jgi:hypothetical protein